jgi:transposase
MAKSKWDQVQSKIHLVEKWARDGLREDQIAKNLGISVTTDNVAKMEPAHRTLRATLSENESHPKNGWLKVVN